MQSGSGAKNPPWARSVNSNMTGMNPQIMDPNAMMGQQSMMPYQQQFNPGMMQAQGGMTVPMAGQMPMNQIAQSQMYPGNVVAYPTPRAMNPGMYQNSQNNSNPTTNEQRVFTGTVTKTHNDFGFVDHDVFYQTSVCAKGVIPKVNDRVLVEATYNPNMPFKWNATRVQVLPKNGPNQKNNNMQKSNNYNAVPPPAGNKNKPMQPRRDDRPPRRDMRDDRLDRKRSRTRTRSRSRDRRDSRARRDSPPRKRPVPQPSPVKFVVRVPRMPLDVQKMDVPTLSQRYTNMYIPSDFFNAYVKWGETFPPQSPFALNNPCAYHIMNREVENPLPNDAVLEPPDADYRFSAKVMLISMPTLESLYQKCGLTKADEKDKKSSSKNPLHPTRLIKFLVGQKGKGGENFAIGGPWSPSLDGDNPQSDPQVLVKTAIRTCKALTGIDLSSCTQWYRMVEFYYWREGGGARGRLESVVLFLPDAWAAAPARGDWACVQERYKAAGEAAERGDQRPPDAPPRSQIENVPTLDDSTITIDENDDDDEDKPEPSHFSKIDLRTIKVDQLRQELRARNVSCKGLRGQLVSRLSKLIKAEEEKENKTDDVMDLDDDDQPKDVKADENKEDEIHEIKDDKDDTTEKKESKPEEKVEEKKEEIKDEKKEEIKEKTEKEIEEEKKKLERARAAIRARYELPSTPHFVVHASGAAKGGKFGCSVASLSLLLDYRATDNKEHSFELFVFAELFNEMLMRDFGFYIYKTLYTLPEKSEEPKEKADDKEKKDDKKAEEKKEDKKDDKDKKEEKKEDKDKRDDKRDSKDSRRKDRRESSDDERSASPRRRGRGVELPADPYLLLSLAYFDTQRGGAVSKRDLQNLFTSLGLQLSRAQVRAVLEKVCVRDSFNYKTLMQSIKDLASGTPEVIQDLPLETTVVTSEVPAHITELEETIAAGNRELLPIFNKPSGEKSENSSETVDVSDSGVVVYKSRVVYVGALVAAEARAGAARARLEGALEAARAQLRAARAAAASTQLAERSAQSQLSDANAALAHARARITSLAASSKIFHSTLKSIQSKVEAVVNIKYEDDDVVEVVNGPASAKKEGAEVKPEVHDEKIEKVEIKNDSEDKSESRETDKDIIASENMDLEDKD